MQAEVKISSDTLEEDISTTILRDLQAIGKKLRYIIVPKLTFEPNDQAIKQLRNWDLWGPLILCLLLTITLNIGVSSKGQSFGMVFMIMTAGSCIVTINSKLLGGNISFFQCVCVLGYCVLPINIAAIIAVFFKLLGFNVFLVKVILIVLGIGWSTLSSISFTAVITDQERKIVAAYPIFLFYLFLGWFVLFI